MPVLRIDPWDPSYGMGFEPTVPEDSGDAHPFVESDDWSMPRSPPPPGDEGPFSFVDGVLRVEVRLLAEEEGRRVPGLFGSYAAGSVRCDGRRASFGEHGVARSVILGGGMAGPGISVPVGRHVLAFDPVAEPSTDPAACVLRLQQVMRDTEARLAARLAAEQGALVLADGPLTFVDPSRAPVVGVVKRFVKHYLEPEHEVLVTRLGKGERTPLFGIGVAGQPIQRYSWYTRLMPLREPWHAFAGILRCEVGAGVGVAAAVALADRVSALLPRFAGGPADPRAPQNLAPVGALEANLRHRLGDTRVIRRALTGWLMTGGGGSWTT